MKREMCRHLLMLTVIIMPALFVSCGTKESARSERTFFTKIDPAEWTREEVVWFEPLSEDSTLGEGTVCTAELIFRISERHKNENIPVVVEIEDAEGSTAKDTIIIGKDHRLYAADIKDCYGIKEITMRRHDKLRLNEGIAVGVSPLASKENSKGMLNVGLRLYY